MNLLREIANALRPDTIEQTVESLKKQLPIYWPENFDEQRRHVVTHSRYDWDKCDECGTYDEVFYWYGGKGVNERGEIVNHKQYPHCRRCQPR